MTTGVEIAHAAQVLLAPDNAPAGQEHGFTLAQASTRIGHLTATKAELLEAIAYLACQWHGARQVSGEDDRLLIAQLRAVFRNHDDARARKRVA